MLIFEVHDLDRASKIFKPVPIKREHDLEIILDVVPN
jgi:hypothetical protein